MAYNILIVSDKKQNLYPYLDILLNVEEINYHFFLYEENDQRLISYLSSHRLDAVLFDTGVNILEKNWIPYLFNKSPKARFTVLKNTLESHQLEECYPESFQKIEGSKESIREFFTPVSSTHTIRVQTINMSQVFVDEQPLDFASKKSKELFFFLLAKEDSIVTMDETMEKLWGESKVNLAKRLYREAVCKLRRTLEKSGIEDILHSGRARLRLCSKDFHVDYREIKYSDEYLLNNFLPEYGWGKEEIEAILNKKKAD